MGWNPNAKKWSIKRVLVRGVGGNRRSILEQSSKYTLAVRARGTKQYNSFFLLIIGF
jgi:hypothetical protein